MCCRSSATTGTHASLPSKTLGRGCGHCMRFSHSGRGKGGGVGVRGGGAQSSLWWWLVSPFHAELFLFCADVFLSYRDVPFLLRCSLHTELFLSCCLARATVWRAVMELVHRDDYKFVIPAAAQREKCVERVQVEWSRSTQHKVFGMVAEWMSETV